MNFLLLFIQSTVCVACVWLSKTSGLISFRDFDIVDAKKWFPISFLLVLVIYTGSKSLVSIYSLFLKLYVFSLRASNFLVFPCTQYSRI